MGLLPDLALPPQLTRCTLEIAEPVAKSNPDVVSTEDTSSTITTNQAGPTSKPQVPILETDYDHVDQLPLSWTGKISRTDQRVP